MKIGLEIHGTLVMEIIAGMLITELTHMLKKCSDKIDELEKILTKINKQGKTQ